MKGGTKMRTVLIALLALAGTLSAIPVDEKVPPEIQVRMRNVQLDQERVKNNLLQLQRAADGMQQQLKHDDDELKSLASEAVAAAKLDPAKWTVDFDKLQFTAKPEKKP
jgi:hypothetical protein